jgi:hypothetical protein
MAGGEPQSRTLDPAILYQACGFSSTIGVRTLLRLLHVLVELFFSSALLLKFVIPYMLQVSLKIPSRTLAWCFGVT